MMQSSLLDGVEMRSPKRAWFCLPHVREYNANWDFFAGMSEEQILSFQKDALTGHRRTLSREQQIRLQQREKALREEAVNLGFENQAAIKVQNVPDSLKNSLSLLELSLPITSEQVKKAYRIKAKEHHPDSAGEDAKERFIQLNEAKEILNRWICRG